MRFWLRCLLIFLCLVLACPAFAQENVLTEQAEAEPQPDPEAEALREAIDAAVKAGKDAEQKAIDARAAVQRAQDAAEKAAASAETASAYALSAQREAENAGRTTDTNEIRNAAVEAAKAGEAARNAALAAKAADAAAKGMEASARLIAGAGPAAEKAAFSTQAAAVAEKAAELLTEASLSAAQADQSAREAQAAAQAAAAAEKAAHFSFVNEEAKKYFYQAPKQVKVTFVGDCTLGNSPRDRQYNHDISFEGYLEKYGLEYPFLNVLDYFRNDDLTVINLEGIFYDFESGKVSKTYNFRTATDNARLLTLCSIEACGIGNNHSMDYGSAGLKASLKALDDLGVGWFGVNQGANGVYIYEKDGIKIGFMSVYYGYWAAGGNNVKKIEKNFTDMKAAGCQVIVACMHCGTDYDVIHDSAQERVAKKLISCGADIVIGHGPHSIQGLRVENGITTLWSLGNFSFGGNTKLNNKNDKTLNIESLMAQITFSFDENNKYLGHQLNLFPAHMSGISTANDYQPTLVGGEEAKRIMAYLQRDCKSIRLNPYREDVGAIQEFVPVP